MVGSRLSGLEAPGHCWKAKKKSMEIKSDIVPMTAATDLTLVEGKVTCCTCHDLHANTNGSMLRVKTMDLGQTCHPVQVGLNPLPRDSRASRCCPA
ncbi:MAG: hypothetical protein HGB21_09225 [Nitrospirae bacterium]|nr:hypothetical protein [Nitrospirota bacterium]